MTHEDFWNLRTEYYENKEGIILLMYKRLMDAILVTNAPMNSFKRFSRKISDIETDAYASLNF